MLIASAKLSKDLDKEQFSAVSSPLTNTCVFAVAGSGKTRVLTYRVANLIEHGFQESEMMLVTFTNKAANEMLNRIKILLNKDDLLLTAGTFHSIAAKYLRQYSNAIGYKENFNIIEPDDCRLLINLCLNKCPLKDNEDFPTKNIIFDIYSGAINHKKTFKEFIGEFYNYFSTEYISAIISILEDFVEEKRRSNVMDFDDLLLNFYDILQVEEIKEKINNEIKYIFVDEYQDINWLQYEILEKLNKNESMFVIGDASQCIYQFRGSVEEYIYNFEKTHKNTQKYKLTYNYRSTPQVLHLAEDAINNNPVPERIVLNTKNPNGKLPLIIGANSEAESANSIAEDIFVNHDFDFNNVAVLVRQRSQMLFVERALRARGIPVNSVGYLSFLQLEHVKDMLALLQLLYNPTNSAAFLRVCRILPGIGTVNSKKLRNEIVTINYDLGKLNPARFTGNAKSSVAFLRSLYLMDRDNISRIIDYICKNFYFTYIKSHLTNPFDRIDDINFLKIESMTYENLSDFLDNFALNTDLKKESEENGVVLTTMHRSKGLEWDYVYIPFICDTVFPRAFSDAIKRNAKNVQNERNLFYVSITRARKSVVLTYTMQYQGKDAGASVFLEELSPQNFEHKFV